MRAGSGRCHPNAGSVGDDVFQRAERQRLAGSRAELAFPDSEFAERAWSLKPLGAGSLPSLDTVEAVTNRHDFSGRSV